MYRNGLYDRAPGSDALDFHISVDARSFGYKCVQLRSSPHSGEVLNQAVSLCGDSTDVQLPCARQHSSDLHIRGARSSVRHDTHAYIVGLQQHLDDRY